MPKRVIADPEGGLPGKIEENGTWVQGVYKIVALVYGPGEVVESGDRTTIPDLREKYWNPAERALVIPFNGGSYEFGPKLLSQTTDTTVVQIRREFWYRTNDPPPEVCSCGRWSFRHSVSYHDTAGQ